MRVYDMAMRAAVEHDPWARSLQQITKEAVVVHAEPVAQWVYEKRKDVIGEDFLKLIDRCVPPFPITMVEFKTGFVMECGAVVARTITETGWHIGVLAWASDLQRQIATIPAYWGVNVSPDGKPDWDACVTDCDETITDSVRRKDASAWVAELLCVALMTFRFMHARGVTITDTQANRHERRRAQKEGKRPPCTFKTLSIDPIKRVLQSEGRVDEVGIAKALHLCRGHFADYTQGAGLFGKHKCEVFVPDHIRGRDKRRVVVKDYSVNLLPGGVG